MLDKKLISAMLLINFFTEKNSAATNEIHAVNENYKSSEILKSWKIKRSLTLFFKGIFK